jgi:hypothetical protein
VLVGIDGSLAESLVIADPGDHHDQPVPAQVSAGGGQRVFRCDGRGRGRLRDPKHDEFLSCVH